MTFTAPAEASSVHRTDRFDRALLSGPGSITGVVSRVFPRAVVVVDAGANPVLTLLPPGSDLVARSIAVPEFGLPWTPGAALRLSGRRVTLAASAGRWSWALAGPGVTLRLDDADPAADLTLPAGASDPATWPARTRALLSDPERTAALPASIEERIDAGLRSALRTLTAALRTLDLDRIQASVAALSGLGTGATPAGDDLIVGVLAGAWRLGLRTGIDAMERAVARLPEGVTTDTARHMVAAALDGDLPEPLREAALALGAPGGPPDAWKGAVARLERLGHGSGPEMLAGLLALARSEGVNDR